MGKYTYCRIRIQDGLVGDPETCTVECCSRIEFLEKLNAWNRNLPGKYQFYAHDTIGLWKM
jgi:hypothetical protein